MLRTLFIAVLAVAVLATENAGTAAINNAIIQTDHLNSVQGNIDALLKNEALKKFYDQYYSRPQDTLSMQISDASERILENAKLAGGHYYPYANQISIDPNVMHRLVNVEPRRHLSSRISDLNRQNAELDAARAASKLAYSASYQNRGVNTAEVRKRVTGIGDNLHQSGLLRAHEHNYSRPFADGANMDKLLASVRKMERVVKAPLTPNLPNAEEIHAMNRLSEKLDAISKRIHQKPTEALHQNAHAQDVMLERASNLIRRLSNSVDLTRRDNFLNALHQELHKHHLHDHKFLNNLESEIAFAIANGTPLQLPREYQQIATAGTYNVQHTPETRFNLNTAVTGGHEIRQNTHVTVNPDTQQQVAAASVDKKKLSNPEYAKMVSEQMENYGRDVMERSREMKHRSEIVNQRTAVPNAQRRELRDHIEHRFVSPPAQVHSLGAARPIA